MQVNEAVKLIASGADLSFAQIKEAFDALSGNFSDTAEFTRLRVMADRKIKEIDTSLFGMSLDEAMAAAAVVKNFTPEDKRKTEDFEKFLGKIEDRISELKIEQDNRQEEQSASLSGENLASLPLVSSSEQEEQNVSQSGDEEHKEETGNAPEQIEILGQERYQDAVAEQPASAQVINRNYEHLSKIVDSVNPLDENDDFFAESRDALDMIDARDENDQPADVNPYLVEQARIRTMADLLTSEEKITPEVFRQHFKNNIDVNTFKVLNADKASQYIRSGDTKGMAAEFSQMVNDFTTKGKKNKKRIDYNTAIALINAGNEDISRFANKLESKFGAIPAVKNLRTRLNNLDAKLTKKYGKAYTTSRDIVKGISGVATDLALVGLAGAAGPVGLGIYSVYTFNRNVSPYLQAYGKAHNKTGIGFMEFAAQHKRDASLAGLYTVSAMLTGFSAAGLAYHNVANSLGANNVDSLTRYISNSKIGIGLATVMGKQGVDVVNAVKHGKNVKEAVGKFALAAGIFAVSAGAREMYSLENGSTHGIPTDGSNDLAATGTSGGQSIVINGDHNEVNIINDHSIDNSTHIDNSTNTTIIDNCCDPCPDCEPVDVPPVDVPPVDEHKPVEKEAPVQKTEPKAPTTLKLEEAPMLELTEEDLKDPELRAPFIPQDKLAAPEIKLDVPEPARPDISPINDTAKDSSALATRAAAPAETESEVLYNGVHDYDNAKEAMNTHAAEGAVQKEDGRYYDQHKSNSTKLDELNEELQSYVNKINSCPEDQPMKVENVKDGARNFDNIQQLIQSRSGNSKN